MNAVPDEIAREAWRREASHHEGHRNFRPHLRPKGANLMGLRGEQAFAEEFGRPLDLTARLDGDGGQDLDLMIGGKTYSVDCKAAIIPKDLIVEMSRCRPETIYVLCRYIEAEDRCEMLGWQWGRVLMQSVPKDYGYGVINYWQPRGDIRSMDDLHRAYRHGFTPEDHAMTDTTAVATTPQNKPPIVVMRERFVARREELKAALPSDIDPDHFIRAITTSAQINPDLQACSFNSLWIAAMRACRDGLLPDGVEAAIVPFKTSASYIAMYRGLLKNFRKSGQCRWITADVVRAGEIFEHYVDENGEHFKHIPSEEAEGTVTKVYAAALTKDGAFYVAVLSMKDIDKIRAMSRATREDAPWKQWPEEMQKKSALRRLSKLLPSGREIIPDDDLGFGLPGLEAPPLQPLAPPSHDEPRRPQSAAASLDTFAGSTNAPAGGDQAASSDAEHGGDGDGVTGTVAATDHEAGQTIDGAEADGDAIPAAYERGKKAKLDGFARKATPPEFRDAARSRELTAWLCGFDGKDMPTWSD